MKETDYSGRDNLDVMLEAKNYNKYLLNLVLGQAEKTDSIVDFGAGRGTFCIPLAGMGYHVTCIETDRVLSEQLLDAGLPVNGDLQDMEDGSVDYIYSLNVLEHIDDDEGTIALWFRKLRPNGKLLVYVPAFQSLYSSMDKKVGHFRRYLKADLSAKLSRAGFDPTTVRYTDSIGFFASLVYKYAGSDTGEINREALRFYDKYVYPLSGFLDIFAHGFLGKNVFAICRKRGG